jgi:hypothetical protein
MARASALGEWERERRRRRAMEDVGHLVRERAADGRREPEARAREEVAPHRRQPRPARAPGPLVEERVGRIDHVGRRGTARQQDHARPARGAP